MSGKKSRALLVPLRTRDDARIAESDAENPDENQWVTTHCYTVCSKQSSKEGERKTAPYLARVSGRLVVTSPFFFDFGEPSRQRR
jgi:hypothetical protein